MVTFNFKLYRDGKGDLFIVEFLAKVAVCMCVVCMCVCSLLGRNSLIFGTFGAYPYQKYPV